jgi:small subunit ribosomal protein S6
MNKYEAIYIIDSALEEGPRKELIAKFNDLVSANGGEMQKVDEWGKRRLAYTIDYKTDGYYVLLHFASQPELPRELERNLQNNESILRYLIVKLEQKRSNVKPRPVVARPIPPFAGQDTPVEPLASVVEGSAPAVEIPVAVKAPAEVEAETPAVVDTPVTEAPAAAEAPAEVAVETPAVVDAPVTEAPETADAEQA